MNEVEVTEPAVLIRISQLYNERMSDLALYEATRGVWKLGANLDAVQKRDAVQYALAVAGGIVREMFAVGQWHPAGTTTYTTRKPSDVQIEGRWEFTGSIAPASLRAKYVGRSVAHYFARGAANPIKYVNV
jgi:hypothetical protein